MSQPRLVLCGGATWAEVSKPARHKLMLNIRGADANVNVRIEDVTSYFIKAASPRLLDLIEIAAYVHAADSATARAGKWNGGTEPWRRDFHFVIPVRDSAFWSDTATVDQLVRLLSFLTDDAFRFSFTPQTSPQAPDDYFEFSESPETLLNYERVILFSGGLDSLAGTIATLEKGDSVLLASHRSVAMTDVRQTALADAVAALYPGQVRRVPVWINKEGDLSREYTQRGRSFLYVAIAALMAAAVSASGIRFFENGIVSLNLPVADEAICARASRTTHPLALHYMEDLLRGVMLRSITVDNPFIGLTKEDVVRVIAASGKGQLIAKSRSCAHGYFQTRTQAHCGNCSQCIDRRIAIIAAGADGHDPAEDYVHDVFRGSRKDGYDYNIAVDYIRHAHELSIASPEQLAQTFNLEISRAVRKAHSPRTAAAQLADAHVRHGRSVMGVLKTKVAESIDDLVKGKLPKHSLLSAVVGNDHIESGWKRLAVAIGETLANGLPAMKAHEKAATEPALQLLCEGLLVAHRLELDRESPLLKWAAIGAKPDWSKPELKLYVELKYVRKKTDVAEITRAIAQDITQYGDRGMKCLFVVYDPYSLVDHQSLEREISTHAGMYLKVI